MSLVTLLLLSCLSASCKGKDAQSATERATSCEAIATHLVKLTESDADQLDERTRSMLRSQLQLLSDQYSKTCRAKGWPAEARACFAASSSMDEFDACAKPLLGKDDSLRIPR